MDNSNLISILTWYLEVKNSSLQKALCIRTPLSIPMQKDLRLHYSQYFYSLISATEMLVEKYSGFKSELIAAMCFEGFENGEINYFYIKEFRNGIIHRGIDIFNSAHFHGDMPMLITPQLVSNRKGDKSYQAFGYYLLDIISKCESVIPKVIHSYIENAGILKLNSNEIEMLKQSRNFITTSTAMPDYVKNIALNINIDFSDIQKSLIDKLIAELSFKGDNYINEMIHP